jgi:hypothetical protein
MQPVDRSEPGRWVRRAERTDDVDDVRRDPVATGLIAWELRPVQQQDASIWLTPQRPERSRRAGRPSAYDDDVPDRVH